MASTAGAVGTWADEVLSWAIRMDRIVPICARCVIREPAWSGRIAVQVLRIRAHQAVRTNDAVISKGRARAELDVSLIRLGYVDPARSRKLPALGDSRG